MANRGLLGLAVLAALMAWQAGVGAEPPQPNPETVRAAAIAPVVDDGRSVAAESSIQLQDRSLPSGVQLLTGTTGRRLEQLLTVQVLESGQPVANARISFRVLSTPNKAADTRVESLDVITNSEGMAETGLILGSAAGDYVIGAFFDGGLAVEPLRIRVAARSPGWVFFLLFGLVGGLGIFILGMDMAGNGLKDAAGERMRGFISALTSNRVIGLVVGVVATAVLQSSSATTVMLVGFVSATMMNLTQAIGVMMGAKIGTTVTTQLIAFNLSEYSLLLVAVGFVLRVTAPRPGLKKLGGILLGFGFIFFGLGIMSSAMRPLRTVPAFTELLVSFGDQPILAVLVAVGFTAIVQSSAATIGLAIALCSGGLLSLEAGLPLAWGAHIGTCATALLSSLGTSRAGKQVAVSHLVFSVLGVAVAFPFLGLFIDGARSVTALMGSTSVARELANGHMLFTITTALLFLPFTRALEWLTIKIVPPTEVEPPFGPVYLNETALEVPVLALEQAHREVNRAAGIAFEMFESTRALLEKPDEAEAARIAANDDKVDILERAIRPFLAKIGFQGLDPQQSARQHAFIYIMQNLEGVGDVLAKEIVAAGRKLAERGLCFSPEGLTELSSYHDKLSAKFGRIVEAMETFDRRLGEEVLQLRFKERALERRLRESHLQRLQGERPETVETSAIHLSVLSNFGAIGRQLDDIAQIILTEL